MNNLENALAELVSKALEGIDKSVGFMETQLPEVIEQAMLWYAVKNGAYALFGLLLLLAPGVFIYKFYSFQKKKKTLDSGDFDAVCAAALIIWALLSIPGGLFLNLEWLQILIAPKLWLIEYAAGLVK